MSLIEALPVEILVRILLRMSPRNISAIIRTCRLMYIISEDTRFKQHYEEIWHLNFLRMYHHRSLEALKSCLHLESEYLVDKLLQLCWKSQSNIKLNDITAYFTQESPEFCEYVRKKITEFNHMKSSRRPRLNLQFKIANNLNPDQYCKVPKLSIANNHGNDITVFNRVLLIS